MPPGAVIESPRAKISKTTPCKVGACGWVRLLGYHRTVEKNGALRAGSVARRAVRPDAPQLGREPINSEWSPDVAQLAQPFQPSPIWQSGRPAHRPFRGLLDVHSR